MSRTVATFLVALSVLGSTASSAQENIGPAPGSFEVTVIPGGGTFFVKGKNTVDPSFGNYDAGGPLTYNITRNIAFEARSAARSVCRRAVPGCRDTKSPNMLRIRQIVLSAPTRSPFVPYIAGGVGGLSVFDKSALAITDTTTFLTGNVGGGVKWYAGRWGLRGDYRFVAVRSQDDAPDFFGKETRYGHRVYAGVLLNVR